MRLLFWGSVAIIAYAYCGYAAWLWLRSKWRPRPVQRGACTPSVSVVMVVRNEQGVLERKMQNLADLDYPPERLELVVVSDGSTDETEAILTKRADDPRFRVVTSAESRGKASGLNDAIRAARGEVIVFTDARQEIEPGAVCLLLENFADPEVGCASGELMLGDPHCGETGQGMGLYWRIEKHIRELESGSGSVVGATGAFYAARRELIASIPPDTILDDVYIPMSIARVGKRVVFDPRARAWDSPNLGSRREFSRKVRTLSGNYQLLQLAPWLLGRDNPLRFEFISHKLVRLLVPFAMLAALVSSAALPDLFYRFALGMQIALYAFSLPALAGIRIGPMSRFSDAAATLVVLNAAALAAFVNFVTGRKAVWTPIAVADRSSVAGRQKEVEL